MFKSSFKVSVIGCGNVGVTSAYAMLFSGIPTELVLFARDVKKAQGEKLDLDHAQPFLGSTQITATDSYQDVANSQLVVVTAGVAQKPGESRLDLVNKNKAIIEEIIPEIEKVAPEAIVLIVSNPVDVLTYHATKISNFKPGRLFGSGTTLDTARFRFHLSEFLHVNPRSIHAYVLGEHGDASFPALSTATVGGQPLLEFPDFSQAEADLSFQKVQQAAYKIIEAKGTTNYAIGVVVARIMEQIHKNARSILPVSVPLQDYYGVSNVALSIPCVVGANGVSQQLKITLSEHEQQQLHHAAEVLLPYVS